MRVFPFMWPLNTLYIYILTPQLLLLASGFIVAALVGYDTGRGLGDFWSDLGFVMVAVVTAGSLYIGGGELVRDLFE